MKKSVVTRTFALIVLFILLTGCPDSRTYMVPMRDGTILATDVYLPSAGKGPWPVLLMRTPYGRSTFVGGLLSYGKDYALVIQDVRGRYDSEGEYNPFYDDGWGDNRDGYDTAAWIINQSWCNGKMGSYGESGCGITQHLLAGATPPGLSSQLIVVAPTDLYSQMFFQGGVLRYDLVVNWLEFQDANYWLDTIREHQIYDSFWELTNAETRAESINAPAFHIGGWYDIFLKGTINGFITRQTNGAKGAKGKQKLLIGPWTHGGSGSTLQGELTYPDNSVLDLEELYNGWYDYWLKEENTGIMDGPPVYYYVMGDTSDQEAPGNEWRGAENWPPYDLTPTHYYLHPEGILSSAVPNSEEAFSTYLFDPENPVPTMGGASLSATAGPYDQQPIENREDVVLFSTAMLEKPLEVTGDLKVILYISSDVLDTDFTAKLTDVYPDGRSVLVADGIIRTRFRDSFTNPELIIPDTIYHVEIDLWAISIIFNEGHRVQLALSSSNYPRFDVNPNTGGDPFDKETMAVAHNTIYYNKSHPSHILLPIVLQ